MHSPLKNFDVLDEVLYIKDLSNFKLWDRGMIHSLNKSDKYNDILYGIVPYNNGNLDYENIIIRTDNEIKRMITSDDIDIMVDL